MSGLLARTWDVRAAVDMASSAGPRPAPTGDQRNAAASWSALSAAARMYVVAVIVGGCLAIAWSMPYVAERNVGLFVLLTLLSVAASVAKIKLPVPRSESTLTVCYVLDFTTLLVLGPHAATLSAGLGAWSQCMLRRREPAPFFQTWFSVATQIGRAHV